eukprot:CAMPEP_0204123818 /NCGR_PEP_ID=MMETSP0361-20130328/9505_1 /ASSEMBLY_ACC=CAM_ASM_000343 /TAXON_ID=268821 /ORGANISM="Scrippsiella Hangoei, Strain SHTV-5" /LENGTH=72 /DNA_ID=CAMNT_0051075315 /DNA_START=329 /DNA_END=547 /DNA_ORIENTATION=+
MIGESSSKLPGRASTRSAATMAAWRPASSWDEKASSRLSTRPCDSGDDAGDITSRCTSEESAQQAVRPQARS